MYLEHLFVCIRSLTTTPIKQKWEKNNDDSVHVLGCTKKHTFWGGKEMYSEIKKSLFAVPSFLYGILS